MAVGDSIPTTVPLPGLLTSVPDAELDGGARDAVVADLAADLAAPGTPGTPWGSYFGSKEMGRLAVLAEVAAAVGDDAARQQALERLHVQLADLLTYDGPDDPRYLAYDPT
jgi:endo-1,3(4)-beta-glucanase